MASRTALSAPKGDIRPCQSHPKEMFLKEETEKSTSHCRQADKNNALVLWHLFPFCTFVWLPPCWEKTLGCAHLLPFSDKNVLTGNKIFTCSFFLWKQIIMTSCSSDTFWTGLEWDSLCPSDRKHLLVFNPLACFLALLLCVNFK